MVFLFLDYAYVYAVGYWGMSGDLWGNLRYGLTLTYFVLSVLAISAATLFTSGVRGMVVYRIAIGSFAVSMLFFLLAFISLLPPPRPNLVFV
jgi:hypothetical protein